MFDAMVSDLQLRGWRKALQAYALVVLTHGAAPPVQALGATEGLGAVQGLGGVLIGQAYSRATGAALTQADFAALDLDDPKEACAWLIDKAWGGYVAVLAQDRRVSPTLSLIHI